MQVGQGQRLIRLFFLQFGDDLRADSLPVVERLGYRAQTDIMVDLRICSHPLQLPAELRFLISPLLIQADDPFHNALVILAAERSFGKLNRASRLIVAEEQIKSALKFIRGLRLRSYNFSSLFVAF